MPRVLVPLAPGFEEIETVTIVDVLRRAGIDVVLAGIHGKGPCMGSRNIVVTPDADFDAVEGPWDLVVLPGGGAGTAALMQHESLRVLLARRVERGAPVAAICAAPMVLDAIGALEGRTYTSHPAVAESISTPGRIDDVVVDAGDVITSKGAGTAMPFALHLVERLVGADKRDDVIAGLQFPY